MKLALKQIHQKRREREHKSPPERVDTRGWFCNKSNAFDWECGDARLFQSRNSSAPQQAIQMHANNIVNHRPFSEKQPLTEKKHPHKVNPIPDRFLFSLAREPNWIMQARYRLVSKLLIFMQEKGGQ